MLSVGSWYIPLLGFFAVSLILLLWVILTRLICRSPRSRNISHNFALIVFSTAYTLLIAEVLVATLLIQSHGFGFTLASKRWFAKYWHPIDSHGYRDSEHAWTDRVLLMVGASFTAGMGIDRIEDRMSGVLARRLGPRWTVATAAHPGWDSAAEFAALAAYPKTPSVIVLTYTPFDIRGAAEKRGRPMPQVVVDPPAYLKPIVDRSSLVNWLYWRFGTQAATNTYWSYVVSAHESPEISADHMADLAKFIQHANHIGAQFYVVIWPALGALSESEKIVRQMSDALKERGAEVIDLFPHLKNRPLNELIVNASDPHPNARIHAEAAELIFQRLAKDGLNGLPRTVSERSRTLESKDTDRDVSSVSRQRAGGTQ
jgi:hypothetical protein